MTCKKCNDFLYFSDSISSTERAGEVLSRRDFLCWLLRISVPKNASPMARTEFFLAPSSLWEDGNGAAHVAVYYLVFERISEVASTAAHNR